MKPASYGARIGAALLDIVIVSVVSYLICVPIFKKLQLDEKLRAFQGQVAAAQSGGELMTMEDIAPIMKLLVISCGLLVVLVFLMHVYYVYFESSASGQTPGKKAFGLRVVDLEGKRITRMQALYREMIRWYVDGLFVIPAFVSMAKTERRQRVGDVLAKTMVIEVSK